MQKVVGIGWAKTGTTTLGACLQTLGFAHSSTRLDLLDRLILGDAESVMSVADGFDSFDDWPWTILFREFDQRYPKCKFIMTTRNDEAWLASYRNMLATHEQSESLQAQRLYLYGCDVYSATDRELLERRHRHEDEVRRHFSQREHVLLEVSWESGHGWQELCAFLDCPIPKQPFPHENRGEYYR